MPLEVFHLFQVSFSLMKEKTILFRRNRGAAGRRSSGGGCPDRARWSTGRARLGGGGGGSSRFHKAPPALE